MVCTDPLAGQKDPETLQTRMTVDFLPHSNFSLCFTKVQSVSQSIWVLLTCDQKLTNSQFNPTHNYLRP